MGESPLRLSVKNRFQKKPFSLFPVAIPPVLHSPAQVIMRGIGKNRLSGGFSLHQAANAAVGWAMCQPLALLKTTAHP
jgi:hypothetical protein